MARVKALRWASSSRTGSVRSPRSARNASSAPGVAPTWARAWRSAEALAGADHPQQQVRVPADELRRAVHRERRAELERPLQQRRRERRVDRDRHARRAQPVELGRPPAADCSASPATTDPPPHTPAASPPCPSCRPSPARSARSRRARRAASASTRSPRRARPRARPPAASRGSPPHPPCPRRTRRPSRPRARRSPPRTPPRSAIPPLGHNDRRGSSRRAPAAH